MAKSDRIKLWLLVLVVVLSGLFLGLMLVNVLFFLLAEMALIILMVRYRYAFIILPCFLAIAVNLLVYDGIISVAYAYLVLLPGLIMGHKARAFSTPGSIVAWGFAPYIVPVVISIAYHGQLMALVPDLTAEIQTLMEEIAGGAGIRGAELESLLVSVEPTMRLMIRLSPGILFTMFVGLVMFSYLGATAVNKYFGAVLPKMSPLYLWKAGEIWLLPLGASLLFILLGGEGLKTIGENLLVFFVHFYAFFGICFIDYYFNRINIPAPLRIIIYIIMIVVVFVAVPVLALLGVIDSRFDFRKIRFSNEN